MKRLFALLAMVILPAMAWPHGGEDHSHDAAPAAPADIAPRAVAQSEDFELTVLKTGGRILLYLDRYADNAPVTGAVIELESGTYKAVAKETEPGLYALPGDAFAKPAKYPLTLSVQAGDTADLLAASLDLTEPEVTVEHVHSWDEWAVWGGAASVLLVAVGFVLARRRKAMKGVPQ
ncbi:MAG TPA: hypothetical protein PKH69_04345 [Thiobacillaceae bacterium]|nr:hypothetical protein [Hydrogenophilales bacterium]MCU0840546.1 hypothetical protein [Thiobacillaceae bacterium]HNQ03820.1 hypothetical protein [Thiobacillaceae bacterium]HNU63638.1 hypothetical protein [Thiobacillaceae bacterium]